MSFSPGHGCTTALALVLCCGGWLAPVSLHGQPPPPPPPQFAPGVKFFSAGAAGQPQSGLPTEVLIGEDFNFQLEISPYPFGVGYGPFVELYLQYDGADCTGSNLRCDGLSFVKAEAQFTTTRLPLTPCPAGPPFVFLSSCAPTPSCQGTTSTRPSCFFGVDPPTCPTGPVAGFQKVVLELPFGSFVPGQPKVTVDITVHVDSFANDGFPLTVEARGGFKYADSPLGNKPPSVDATCPMLSAKTTPRVVRLTKQYQGREEETATGPNFPQTYKISVDVADGQVVDNLRVTDCLPGSQVYLSTTAPGAFFVSGLNCLEVDYPQLTGGLNHPNASFNYDVYVPENDLFTRQPVLGGDCKTPVLNDVGARARWTPQDPRESSPVDVTGKTDHTITAKCIALQKSFTESHDTGTRGPTPGDTLAYELDFQVSDFLTFQGIVLDDYLSDGLTLVPGSASLSVSDQDGALAGASRRVSISMPPCTGTLRPKTSSPATTAVACSSPPSWSSTSQGCSSNWQLASGGTARDS